MAEKFELSPEVLKKFQPEKKFFVAFDSDGCIFDTMEIKHKECFIPAIIHHWELQAVSKYAREAAEFVNLYSKWRGINRFPALLKVFDLLEKRQEVVRRGVRIPQVPTLREWVSREKALGNPTLKAEVARTNDPVLARTLKWSEAVNKRIEEMVYGVPPFPFVRELLEKAKASCDMIVVSQTPTEALVREWEEHKIASYVSLICGQEMGSKTDHLTATSKGRYPKDHVLMVGDAEGDLKAARTAGALFFPINPGREEESWERFWKEGFDRFLSGRFAGDYEAKLIEEFQKYLPEKPPWER
ncbi:MAG: HAD family hydrolase [Planctomycetota bacterium]|nr:HAD family hydrolase [Planctomycetota bacterium]